MNSKEIIKQAEKDLREQFEIIDEIRDFNQEKVLNAFIENKVAPEHFYTVSGYGHDDMGREVLDKVFADVFKAEKAIARIHFASGTHTLACVLSILMQTLLLHPFWSGSPPFHVFYNTKTKFLVNCFFYFGRFLK